MAGDDPVALDAVVAHMMGFTSPPRIIDLAAGRGYGVSDLSKVKIIGVLEVIDGFKLPAGIGDAPPISGIDMNAVTAVKPKVNNDLCSLCGTCLEHCPAGALYLDGYPVADPGLCITCFCCQELCPQKAIELK